MPWPPEQETPYPARVRLLDQEERTRWASIVVDPTLPDAEEEVVPMRLERALRAKWLRKYKARHARIRGALAQRVADLEAEIEKLKRERGGT